MIYCDTYNEFYTERLTKARKPHRCCETRRPIHPGEAYWRCAGKTEGYLWSVAQSIPAYHFARWLNHASKFNDGEACIAFGGIDEFVMEVGDADLSAEWELVKAGVQTRDATDLNAVKVLTPAKEANRE